MLDKPLARMAGLLLLATVVALLGCAGTADLLVAYTGGGLPPGAPDIGGVVVAAVPTTAAATATTAQAQQPVIGAEVVLMRGGRPVGTATSGAGGYFRFEKPAGGSYRVVVTPPAGSGLRGMSRDFRHHGGQQTFLTIVLERQ